MIIKYLILIFCILEFVKLPKTKRQGEESSSDSAQASSSPTSCGDSLPPYVSTNFQSPLDNICYRKRKGSSFHSNFYEHFNNLIQIMNNKFPIELINPLFDGMRAYSEIQAIIHNHEFYSGSPVVVEFSGEVKKILANSKLYKGENHIYLTHLLLTNDFLSPHLLWNVSYIKPIELIWKSVSTEEKIQRILFNAKLILCGDIANAYEHCVRSKVQEYKSQKDREGLNNFFIKLIDKLNEVQQNRMIFHEITCPMVAQIYLMATILNDHDFMCVRPIIESKIQEVSKHITDSGHSSVLYVQLSVEDIRKLSGGAQASFGKWILDLKLSRKSPTYQTNP